MTASHVRLASRCTVLTAQSTGLFAEAAGLLFDLDDTLLDHGRLTLGAYGAMWELAEAGVPLLGVTGRPLGWARVLVRQWPVLAIVAENGAVAAVADRIGTTLWDNATEAERRDRRERLGGLLSEVLERFPWLQDSEDCSARLTDHTFDIGERVQVERPRIDEVRAAARELGLRTTLSSVHLHMSLESMDKASGTLALLRELRGLDPTTVLQRWVYVGDSENDAPCFAAFSHSVGVANLKGRFSVPPRFITRSPRGAGFAELARALLGAREGAA